MAKNAKADPAANWGRLHDRFRNQFWSGYPKAEGPAREWEERFRDYVAGSKRAADRLRAATEALLPAMRAARLDSEARPARWIMGELQKVQSLNPNEFRSTSRAGSIGRSELIEESWRTTLLERLHAFAQECVAELLARTARDVKAKPGASDDHLQVLRVLALNHPNAVKVCDLTAYIEERAHNLPERLRADRALRKVLAAMRAMVPPLAAKGDRKGYHVATVEGMRLLSPRRGRIGR